MTHQHDLETASAAELTETARISLLTTDLHRINRLLDGEIAREEKEAGVFDLSDPTYPIAARLLRVRRDNLANTIAVLEKRLASVQEQSEGTDNWTPASRLASTTKRNDKQKRQQ